MTHSHSHSLSLSHTRSRGWLQLQLLLLVVCACLRLSESVAWTSSSDRDGERRLASLLSKPHKPSKANASVVSTVSSELVDIGVVAACVPKKFQRFKDRIDFSSQTKWASRVRFLMIRYPCRNPSNVLSLDSTHMQGFPLVVADTIHENFTRSSYINQLHGLVRPQSRLLVVDVDMQMNVRVLQNSIKYVKPGTIYFPIVWSKYSPRLVARLQKEMAANILPYSGWEGAWRVHGFGMFVIHAEDLPRSRMNESFVGWGGEDNEFYMRMQATPGMTVVREREAGLVHVWHDKNCTQIVENPKKKFACMGSRATYLGPAHAMMLVMDDALKRANDMFIPALQYSPRILIIVPTSLSLLRTRLPGIMTTWAKDLPPNVAVKFFISSSIAVKAQLAVAALGYQVDFIAIEADDEEYPPVRRNVAMLAEATALMEDFKWCLKVDDDTFVDVRRLQQLTFDLRSLEDEPHLLGGRGSGREQDKQFLSLPPTGFCMGGPGYLMTKAAMLSVMPHLFGCVDYFDRHTYRDFLWHSDTVISKCFHRWTGLECWDKGVDNVYPFRTGIFQQHYPNTEAKFDSVTFHSLKTSEDMVAYSIEKKRYDDISMDLVQ